MALLLGIRKLFGPLLDDLTASVQLKRPWSCRRREEEDEVVAASSSDTRMTGLEASHRHLKPGQGHKTGR